MALQGEKVLPASPRASGSDPGAGHRWPAQHSEPQVKGCVLGHSIFVRAHLLCVWFSFERAGGEPGL